MTASARTCLWFDREAEEAADFYVSLFDDAEVEHVFPQRGDPEGRAFMVQWRLMDQKFSGINGGTHYTLGPAASIEIHVDGQAEVDRLWAALLADGGKESRCGWLTDRFGLSWQILPRRLMELMRGDDAEAAGRVTQAMLKMVKIDVAELEAAASA